MNKNATALLGILQEYAPTGTEQQKCTEIYLAMQQDGITGNDLILRLAGMLVDGLRHGNWPWL